jgi:hypothetical protein
MNPEICCSRRYRTRPSRLFRPHMKPMSLPRGMMLWDISELLRRVYFVEGGAVSLMTVFKDGTTAEMATVGCEGSSESAFSWARTLPSAATSCLWRALPARSSAPVRRRLRRSRTLRTACERDARAFRSSPKRCLQRYALRGATVCALC